MSRQKIPVYDICSLAEKQLPQNELLAERFNTYLKRHSHSLHNAHRHSFYHLILFTKGGGNHTIDFNQFKVKPFDIYFMIPGQVHSWQFQGEADGYIINFSENFFRSFLLQPYYLDKFSFFSGISEEGVCHLPSSVHNKIIQLFEEILLQINTEKENSTDMIRLLLLNLFITTDDACKSNHKTIIPRQKQVLLKNFRRLIEQHYVSIKLPKEYADLLYVTPNHLNALCQDLLGKTAGELIRDRVLLEAKRLLTNADMTVTEIAFALNFLDNSYFNRFFKKYERVTPDEFRKQFIIH